MLVDKTLISQIKAERFYSEKKLGDIMINFKGIHKQDKLYNYLQKLVKTQANELDRLIIQRYSL